MAQVHQSVVEDVVNQENISSRLVGKTTLNQPIKGLSNRAALGEVGNKLPNVHCQVNTGATKKYGILGPPAAVKKTVVSTVPIKKEIETVVSTVPIKKEIVKKAPEQFPVKNKAPIKRQETIAKNIKVEMNKPVSKAVVKSYSCKQLDIVNPDENTKNEPQMVTEYLGDIFNYLRELESKYPIRENYLEIHETTSRMRTILVNWLVEVHTNFKLYLETLHLCIAIIDRYLQDNKNVGRNTLQLVGASALLIASKYEEMYMPDLADFVYICDDTFSPKQILQMEMEILKKLDFNLGRPLSVHFLRRYDKIAQVRSEHHTLGKYLLELALVSYGMCHIKPSIQAAAACCLSMAILNEVMDISKLWTPTLAHYSTYEYSDIRSTVVSLACLIAKSDLKIYQVVNKKYASSSYGKISINSKLNGPLVRKLASMKK